MTVLERLEWLNHLFTYMLENDISLIDKENILIAHEYIQNIQDRYTQDFK